MEGCYEAIIIRHNNLRKNMTFDEARKYTTREFYDAVYQFDREREEKARKIWQDQHNIEDSLAFMAECGCRTGGWPAFYFVAQSVGRIEDMMHKLLGGQTSAPTPLPAQEAPKPSEPYTELHKACKQFDMEREEGNFFLVFDPGRIAKWIRDNREVFGNTVALNVPSTLYKYSVQMGAFLERLLHLRAQKHKKIFAEFRSDVLREFLIWRLNKYNAQGHC